MFLIVLLKNVNMIYWKYGSLSMISMLLNNIYEIYNHNIVKQDECIFIGKYIIREKCKTVQL